MEKDKKEDIRYPEIAEEILRRAQIDQEMRKEAQAKAEEGDWSDFDESIDRDNTEWMKNTIDEIGWPTRSLVGKRASYMAWLLVQHADHDVRFQERCLDLMKELPKGEVVPQNIAYLEDRARVNIGKDQVYGTQFYTDENGLFGPRPIEDSENVDKRRQQVGLGTLEEYAKSF